MDRIPRPFGPKPCSIFADKSAFLSYLIHNQSSDKNKTKLNSKNEERELHERKGHL